VCRPFSLRFERRSVARSRKSLRFTLAALSSECVVPIVSEMLGVIHGDRFTLRVP
jgi:hypothetical protein